MRLPPHMYNREPLTVEDACRVEAHAEKESTKRRQASLARAREEHAAWLRSLGFEPPAPLAIVPDAPAPKRARRGRPRRCAQ